MTPLKYRQAIFVNGDFSYWHYWGFIEQYRNLTFVAPETNHSTIEEAYKNSYQCVGLKDKNDKEIYEGDIVEFNVVKPIWDDKSECVIEHRPETWRRVIVYKAPHFVMHWFPHKMEVIGNIIENPELVEATK